MRNMLYIVFNAIKSTFLDFLRIRRKPRILQLPITGKCNSRCVTCNVWKFTEKNDIDPVLLRQVLKDRYLNKVAHVGVNGGELTQCHNFGEIIESILTLPRIKSISAISNGIFTNKLLERLAVMYKLCKERDVFLSVTLSIDGVGKIHDYVRGINGSFEKTISSLRRIMDDRNKYCDIVNVGCTISRFNVFYLSVLDVLLKKNNIPVEYHIAVPNKRIATFNDAERYSLLSDDRARLMAIEFFFSKMHDVQESRLKRINYYLQLYYLMNNGEGRLFNCSFKYRDITIDENLLLYLCATASDCIGDLKKAKIKEFKRNGKLKKIERQVEPNCEYCIHYAWLPNISGLFLYIKHVLKDRLKIAKFKLLLKL